MADFVLIAHTRASGDKGREDEEEGGSQLGQNDLEATIMTWPKKTKELDQQLEGRVESTLQRACGAHVATRA